MAWHGRNPFAGYPMVHDATSFRALIPSKDKMFSFKFDIDPS